MDAVNTLEMHRLELKLMQQEVADMAGISLISYQRYEHGIRNPQIHIAFRIAEALNTTVDNLWKKGGDSY